MKQQVALPLILVALLLFIPKQARAQSNGGNYTQNSVLSSGNWMKVKVGSTGIYKLSYSDLINMGISEPKNVQVYGYGGWILDEDFTQPYIDDLPQVAIWMSKPRSEFGEGDYILFYAKGDIKWAYDQSKKEFVHTQNPYSSDSYYFITESEDGPLLMTEATPTGTAAVTVSTFSDYYLHEKELINIEKTGREFYGEDFLSTKSQNFDWVLQGATSAPAILRYSFIAKAPAATYNAYLNLTYNNVPLKKSKLPFSSANKADEINDTLVIKNLAGNATLNLTYTAGGGDSHVHLNYLRLEYERYLKPYGSVTLFRSKVLNSQLGFKIAGASDKMLLFDVTKPEIPQKINASLSGSEMSFTASNSAIREYALVDTNSSDIPSPSLVGQVENQNLHSLAPKEMVIIVSAYLKNYAGQLAQIHNDESGMESIIVTSEDIYNEFSSGKPDVTAYRRFLKMFYDRNKSTAPQYLLLFGDGAYDNRFLGNPWSELQKKTMLLTYQTVNSLTEESSLVTDDYIGFLDNNEAGIVSINNSVLDIGIGRLPVQSETEARNAVNKIKNYIENKDKGLWKNNIAFYADDLIAGTVSNESFHCAQSDGFAETIKGKYPEFIVNKIYQDNYERVATPAGARCPDATKEFKNKLNSGLLVMNYVGHGSTRDWTHEFVLTFEDVQKMNNKRLPLWITATCDFSRFDDYVTSAGEMAFLNPNGGAIALISTTRIVLSVFNEMLDRSVLNHIFEKKNNKPLRLGDILRSAKIDLGSQQNKLKFTLLGDPALRLSYPGDAYHVRIDEVNGLNASDANIKIQALASNRIKGVIVNSNDEVVTDFTGNLDAVIFDNELELKTRGNKLATVTADMSITYKDYPNTIYSGSTPITNGAFTIDFVTPIDILYTSGSGKMSFYASGNNGKEAQGSFLNYKVGGRFNGTEETNSPVIRQLYLNKDDFQPGDKVGMSPVFYAEIYDDTGINLSNAIGHNISLTIDGLKSYNLSSGFVSKEPAAGETGALGSVSFTIPDLTEGKHTLQFKAWDVFNNSTTETIEFESVAEQKPRLFKFKIQGNPAETATGFIFYSDLTDSNVDLKYEVYSSTGALQWSHEEAGVIDYSEGYHYQYDLTASDASKLQPGVYICRMSVSVNGKVRASESEKLVVLEQ
ncbi:type IX secretion system sortase PorU [Viscerimonas tarda]